MFYSFLQFGCRELFLFRKIGRFFFYCHTKYESKDREVSGCEMRLTLNDIY